MPRGRLRKDRSQAVRAKGQKGREQMTWILWIGALAFLIALMIVIYALYEATSGKDEPPPDESENP